MHASLGLQQSRAVYRSRRRRREPRSLARGPRPRSVVRRGLRRYRRRIVVLAGLRLRGVRSPSPSRGACAFGVGRITCCGVARTDAEFCVGGMRWVSASVLDAWNGRGVVDPWLRSSLRGCGEALGWVGAQSGAALRCWLYSCAVVVCTGVERRDGQSYWMPCGGSLVIAILKTAAGGVENQDRGLVMELESGAVLVVADGAGGLGGGARAAVFSVEFLRAQARRLVDSSVCAAALRSLDQEICLDEGAGETTCALVVVGGSRLFGASVGDSGVWVVGSTGVTDLTGRQVRKPLIGSGEAEPVGFVGSNWVRGDKLLLATDGLLKYTSAERIVGVCREGDDESCAARLIELVRYSSGRLPDDVTVIVATR